MDKRPRKETIEAPPDRKESKALEMLPRQTHKRCPDNIPRNAYALQLGVVRRRYRLLKSTTMNQYHVTSRFSLRAMNGKSVTFQVGLPEGGEDFGVGFLRAWNAPEKGKKIIAIESPNPPAQRYRLNQHGADRLEPNPEKESDFVCILPRYGFSASSGDMLGQ